MSIDVGRLDEHIERLRAGDTLTENEVRALCEKVRILSAVFIVADEPLTCLEHFHRLKFYSMQGEFSLVCCLGNEFGLVQKGANSRAQSRRLPFSRILIVTLCFSPSVRRFHSIFPTILAHKI
jgi:hypothetical protein